MLTPAYVSVRQRTSAYVSVRQRTSAYVSVRQHTSAYVECPHLHALDDADLLKALLVCVKLAFGLRMRHTSAYQW
jgi:hypothetical protein